MNSVDFVDITGVSKYLDDMMSFWEPLSRLSSIELYSYFLNLEDNYVSKKSKAPLANSVHMLYSENYLDEVGSLAWYNLLLISLYCENDPVKFIIDNFI